MRVAPHRCIRPDQNVRSGLEPSICGSHAADLVRLCRQLSRFVCSSLAIAWTYFAAGGDHDGCARCGGPAAGAVAEHDTLEHRAANRNDGGFADRAAPDRHRFLSARGIFAATSAR